MAEVFPHATTAASTTAAGAKTSPISTSTVATTAPGRSGNALSRGVHSVASQRMRSDHPIQIAPDVEDMCLVYCRCDSVKAVSTLLQCLQHVATSGGLNDVTCETIGTANQTAGYGTTSRGRRTGSSGGFGMSTGATSTVPSASTMQPVTVFASPSSLTFHVFGKAKQTQASVDLQAGLFSDYHVAKPSAGHGHDETATIVNDHQGGASTTEDWQAGGEFCVNLSTVMDCLHIQGTTGTLEKTNVSFSYSLSREIFNIELFDENSGILSITAIPGMLSPIDYYANADEDGVGGSSLALAFRSSPIAARIIYKSEILREIVVTELETIVGASEGSVSLSNTGGFEITVVGHLGECMIAVPAHGSHVVSFEISSEHDERSIIPRFYPLRSLLGSMKGLDVATETCITINTAGMMAIQHQVIDQTAGDGNPNFVDFIMCPLENETESDTESQNNQENTSTSVVSPTSARRNESISTPDSKRTPSPLSLRPAQLQNENDESVDLRTSQRFISNHDDSATDDDEDNVRFRQPAQSMVSSFFASVVSAVGETDPSESINESNTHSASANPLPRPLRRRRFRPSSAEEHASSESHQGRRLPRPENESHNLSQSLLDQKADAQEEIDEGLVDAAVPASPVHYLGIREDDDCSSPELVYGRQR